MKRRDFGNDSSGQFIDKEPGESTSDLKNVTKGALIHPLKRRELEIGLQAANPMINIQTQTYYNRNVNASTTYDAKDFYGEVAAGLAKDAKLNERLDKFIDRVAPRVERQLQSNEIINVF